MTARVLTSRWREHGDLGLELVHLRAERVDDQRIELVTRAARELLERGRGRQRLAIGPRGRHGVVGDADRDHAGAERDLLAGDAVRIAAAVVALVARAHEAGDGRERGRGGEDALADDRVAPDLRPLLGLERGALAQHRLGDREHADVLELGGAHDVVELAEREAEAAADADRMGGDARERDGRAAGAALGEDLEQHVSNLALGGEALQARARLHALQGDRQRGVAVWRLVGNAGLAAHRAGGEALGDPAERAERRGGRA